MSSTAPKIFLSYARKDGETYATALRRRLERDHSELTLWQDRAEMEGGVGWWTQIEAALDQVQFLVIVMTPRALASEVTRKEWRYARQRGVIVYPVKGVPDDQLDFASVPNWMRKAHWFALGALDAAGALSPGPEWETFIRHLQSHHERRCVPFMAPDMPEWFVTRPREFDQLLSHVLDPKRENPVGITTALRGAGGYGKTTLAAALCHEDRVIEAFDDGILWATLGQTPNLLGELTKLYEALTREQPTFVDVNQAAIKLGEKLEGRNCLLVIDDVWRRSDLEPFMRGGKGCARLITTRRFDVAGEVRWIKVDEMATDEAVELLTKRLPEPPTDLSPFRALARRLGEWPLLLKLAGGALRSQLGFGASLDDALRFVNEALGEEGVTVFDATDSERRDDAVARTVGASLHGLKPDERQRLFELAIFPEDTDIPLTTLGQLWGLNRFKTQQTVQTFANLALLDLNLQQGSLRLHDVMRAFLAKQLGDQVVVHQRLVDAWGDPHKLPDAYAWRWVAYHLVGAGQRKELRRVLVDFEWLQPKLEATDVAGLVADYEYLRRDEELGLVQSAIRLSSHAIGSDKSQLAGQLVGRLSGEKKPGIERLVKGALAWRGVPWLRPLFGNLRPPRAFLLQTLTGHTDRVMAVAVSSDRKLAVSGSRDRTLRAWDLARGCELRSFRGHHDTVTAVALSADGRLAVSGCEDGTLKVWEFASGQELHTLRGHVDSITAVAVSADGVLAVSSSKDATLKVWELPEGRELRTLAGHRDGISGVALSSIARLVVSASWDGTLKVWEVDSGREVRTLSGHSEWTTSVAVSVDGRFALSGSWDQTLKIWEVRSGRELRTLRGHCGWVSAIGMSADGNRAVSVSQDQTLKVWDLQSGKELSSITGLGCYVNGVALSSDGQLAVTASDDRTLSVWRLSGDQKCEAFRGQSRAVTAVAVSESGRLVVTASEDRTLVAWDLKHGTSLRSLRGHESYVTGVGVSERVGVIVSASWDRTFKVWELEAGPELRTIQGHTWGLSAIAVSRDGKVAVSASHDRTLKVWELATGRELCSLTGHSDAVAALALSQDDRLVVSASYDKTLKVWELANGREVRTLRGHSGLVSAVAVSPNGCLVVSGSKDHTLKVWDLLSGRELRTVEIHNDAVWGVAVSPDGRLVLSGSSDQTLKVWELSSGVLLSTFTGEGPIRCCAFALDGRTIVAGEGSGRVHFLRLVLPDDTVG